MLTRSYLLQTTMTRGRSLFKPCSLETRSSSGTCGQDPCSHGGQDCIQSSSPPQLQQNCWDISPGYILTTLNEYQPRTSGPPKWWAQPNCGWYVLLILTLLPTLTEAADCSQCMRGIGKDCYLLFPILYFHAPGLLSGKNSNHMHFLPCPGKNFLDLRT